MGAASGSTTPAIRSCKRCSRTMIQVVSMSDLLLDKQGVHPDAAAIAHQIRDTQLAKIEAMIAGSRPWAALMPRRALHGMMTENDMQQLGTALCHPRRPRDP